MAFGPVVTCARLAKHKVVRSIQLTVETRSYWVHCAGLQIDQYRTWNIFTTARLVVIHIDALQLQLGIAIISASCIDWMLIGDYLRHIEFDWWILNGSNRMDKEKFRKKIPPKTWHQFDFRIGRLANGRFHASCRVNCIFLFKEENHKTRDFFR